LEFGANNLQSLGIKHEMVMSQRMVMEKAGEDPVVTSPTAVDVGVHQSKNGHGVVIQPK